jgi:prepilin-type N-terminal cleavage/methylation domain-containing protein
MATNMETTKSQRGFTLLELLIASSLGLVVILAMTSLFKTGMDATFTVTQRLEVQQNMRSAIELMGEDISHAGAGLPTGGLALVQGGTVSKIGCDQQSGTCYLPNGTYPNSGLGVPNFMYGIIPGFTNGVQNSVAIPNATGQVNDSITSIYADYNFPLTNFNFSITDATHVAVTLRQPPFVTDTTKPTNILAAGGLNSLGGDVLLFLVNVPGTGKASDPNGNSLVQNAAVAAEVTGIAGTVGTTACAQASGCTWTLTFATGDALNLNQTGGTTDNLSAVSTAVAANPATAQTSVSRLNVVSYFLQVPTTAGIVQTPRLMRQVSGFTPVPVADNIINLQFSYDVIDSVKGTINANLADPIGAGQSPSLIQKVNMAIMGESLTSGGNKSQSMYLMSSVAARDMSFCNSYSDSSTVCQ